MTRQELFNTVVTQMSKQGFRRSMSPFTEEDPGVCAYRGASDMKCAAGVLLKDEFYSPQLEGRSVDSRAVADALLKSGVSINDLDFLRECQRAHDNATSPERMKDSFQLLADDNQLTMPVLS